MTFNPNRRKFLATSGKVVAGITLFNPLSNLVAGASSNKKMRIAIVGTGVRAVGMYGKKLLAEYQLSNATEALVEFVDKRLELALANY